MKKFNDTVYRNICRLLADTDLPCSAIGRLANVSESTVYRIYTRAGRLDISCDYSFLNRLKNTIGVEKAERAILLLKSNKFSVENVSKYTGINRQNVILLLNEIENTIGMPRSGELNVKNIDDETRAKFKEYAKLMSKSKYIITTDSPPEDTTKNIIVNGIKTKYTCDINGVITNAETGRTIARHGPYPRNKQATHFIVINKKRCSIMTKRIIAALFIPIPDKYKDIGQEYLTVYHKNRNYEDLSTENLGWYYRRDPDITKSDLPYYLKHTPSEINTVCNLLKSREWTIADAVSCLNCTPDTIASYMRNTKSYRDMMDDIVLVSRCNEETIEKFCRDLQNDNDASVLAIARRNNISSNTAYAIYHRKLYKHISDNYMWKDREYYLSEK